MIHEKKEALTLLQETIFHGFLSMMTGQKIVLPQSAAPHVKSFMLPLFPLFASNFSPSFSYLVRIYSFYAKENRKH